MRRVMYNILLITADHMRHDSIACNTAWSPTSALAHVVQTPNLDRMAELGVTFASSFTPNPICVPARASITTGNYSHKCTGYKSNSGCIRPDQKTIAGLFAENGYATYAIGKLHYVPYSPPGQPRLLHGFQYAELNEEGRILARFDPNGELEGLEDYHDYLKSVGWGGYERAHGSGNNDVRPVPSPLPAEHHEEAWVAKRTIAVLEKHLSERSEQAFLMWTSFSKPHSPYDPPRPYDTTYDPRKVPEPLGGWDNEEIMQGRDPELIVRRRMYGWDWLSPQAVQMARAHYCGMVTFQDAMIGKILEFLELKGLMDGTIIVYTSDHGDLLGDFGRFFKTSMFDGSVKVPMIWSIPGLTNEDDTHQRHQLVGLQDILPTLCNLTHMALPREVDGMDLTPILKDADAPGRNFYVSQTLSRHGQKAMIRTSKWKYVYSELNGVEELYDVRKRNGELENLATGHSYAGVAKEMRQSLIQWCLDEGDLQMVPNGKLAVEAADGLPLPEFSATRMGWRRF